MSSATNERIYYNYILKNPEYAGHVQAAFFEIEDIRLAYELYTEFYKKYSQAPTEHQLTEVARMKQEFGEEKFATLDRDKLRLIYDIDLNAYDKAWLLESIQTWVKVRRLVSQTHQWVQWLKLTKRLNSENVDDAMSMARSIFSDGLLVNFDFDEGLDFFDADAHVINAEYTVPTGYDYLDKTTGGGWSEGALYVVAGASGVGKSIWLANLAAQGFRNGLNVAVISLEIRERKLMRRLGANLLNIPINTYQQILDRDPAAFRKKLQFLKSGMSALSGGDEIPGGNIRVKEFPTSTVNVLQIEAYLRKMEELKGEKFKLIVLDYLNLLLDQRGRKDDGSYTAIKHICEDLRGMALRNNWILVSATQLNSDGMDPSVEITMKHIAESKGLVHTVDGLWGVVQDPLMKSEGRYKLKSLKLRDAEGTHSYKFFKIDYEHMRITEDNSPIVFGGLAA
jgi:replicative DNA helicase